MKQLKSFLEDELNSLVLQVNNLVFFSYHLSEKDLKAEYGRLLLSLNDIRVVLKQHFERLENSNHD